MWKIVPLCWHVPLYWHFFGRLNKQHKLTWTVCRNVFLKSFKSRIWQFSQSSMVHTSLLGQRRFLYDLAKFLIFRFRHQDKFSKIVKFSLWVIGYDHWAVGDFYRTRIRAQTVNFGHFWPTPYSAERFPRWKDLMSTVVRWCEIVKRELCSVDSFSRRDEKLDENRDEKCLIWLVQTFSSIQSLCTVT